MKMTNVNDRLHIKRYIKRYIKQLISGVILTLFLTCPIVMLANALYSVTEKPVLAHHCCPTNPNSDKEPVTSSSNPEKGCCSLDRISADEFNREIKVESSWVFVTTLKSDDSDKIHSHYRIQGDRYDNRSGPPFYLRHYFSHAPPIS